MKPILIMLPLLLSGCSTLGILGTLSDEGTLIEIRRDMTFYEDFIIEQEGYRRHPYPDAGGLAVGYGRNLTNNGINEAEARILLRYDLDRLKKGLSERYPVADRLDSARYAVVLSMAYNLGLDGVGEFKKMWNAIRHGQYVRASHEMKLSRWCVQVKSRCDDLAEMMASGKWA